MNACDIMVTAKPRRGCKVEGLLPLAAVVVVAVSLLVDCGTAVVVNDDFSRGGAACFFAVAILSSGIVEDSLALKAGHRGVV
jgi:hypothetical protein